MSPQGKAVLNGDLVRFESKGGTMTSLALVFRGGMVNIRQLLASQEGALAVALLTTQHMQARIFLRPYLAF